MGKKPEITHSLITIDFLKNDIDSIRNDLKEYIKKNEVEKHYATKFRCGSLIITGILILCAAYYYSTPIYIKSETSALDKNISEILKRLPEQPKSQKK